MTHIAQEQSRARGKPRDCYHFFRGVEDWRYTSFRTAIAFMGEIFTPLEITHGEIEGGGQDRPGEVPITLPTDSPLGLILQAGSAPTPIAVKIYRFHHGVMDDFAIIFNGEVQGADIDGETCVIQAVPLQSRMSMIMPRGLFQKKRCIWNTYDPMTCKANPGAFTFTNAISAITGLVVTVPGAAAFNADPSFFSLGVMSKGERKGTIELQNGDDMRLEFMIPGLAVGNSVSLLAGDDRTQETCLNKFNNIDRHRSLSQMPTLNTFSGQGLRP